ncbi:MAG: 50S ribosomal protein L10 [Acidimicrobiia bacterium]|nr:50S ribosomal protein L10 [Acidimicrobiia bacterium]
MAREDKVQLVKAIKARFDDADAVFITEFSGLTVGEQQALRRGLREGDTEYKVLKMSLTRRAVANLDVADELEGLLVGPTALAFTKGDPVTAAKTLKAFGTEHEALQIKGMLFSGEVLAPEKVSELAALDTRDVMLAKVAGMLAAPMSNMAGLMAAFTRNAASMFSQLRDKLEAQGDPNAPDAPPPAEESSAEELATREEPASDDAVASTESTTEEEPADDQADPSAQVAPSAQDQTQEEQEEEATEAAADNDQPDAAGEEE